MNKRFIEILKVINLRVKQYGFFTSFKRYILLKTIELVYINYKNYLLTVPNHKKQEIDNNVKLLSKSKLDCLKEKKMLSDLDYNRYFKIINNNSIGYYIEIENNIAAVGFVQIKGIYKYGDYYFKLPNNVHMLKNLFVKPEFRGMSLGKKINEARINDIPSSCIPCVFCDFR